MITNSPRFPRLVRLACLASVFPLLSGTAALAQDSLEFQLQGARDEGGVAVLRLDVERGEFEKRLTLTRSRGAATPIDLHLGHFRGAGDSAELGLAVPGSASHTESLYLKAVAMEDSILDLSLTLPRQWRGVELRGQLSVIAIPAGESTPVTQTWEVLLIPPPATLLSRAGFVGAAALMILLGIAASTFSEVWLDLLRKRHDIQRRINDIRPVWLRSEPSWPPVIRVKAMLKQAQDRSDDAWMTSSELIDKLLDQAESLLQLLGRARSVRMGFQDTQMPTLPWLVRFRARAILRRIMRGIGVEALDDVSQTGFEAELAELEAWLEPKELPKLYTASILGSIEQLLLEVREEGFPEEDRGEIKALIKNVTEGMESLRGADRLSVQILRTVERFAALKLLWERRGLEEEYAELITHQKEASEINQFFDVADRAAWHRLCREGKLEIRTPQITGRKLEAFEPIRFEVHSRSLRLDMTHLFHYELDWNWTIRLEPRRRWWKPFARAGKAITLTPHSTEPQVIQFASVPGTLTASVIIAYRQEDIEKPQIEVELQESIEIVESEAFRRWRALRGAEGIATGLAAAAALLIGLQSEYFGNPSFGNPQDYMHLFLWGFGTDKVKSFVAKIGARAPSAAAD